MMGRKRHTDSITMYHRSYSEVPPHLQSMQRSMAAPLSEIADLKSEDAKSKVGSANMSDLAFNGLAQDLHSGLLAYTWRSDTGNPYRDQRGVLLSSDLDHALHAQDTIFTGPLDTVSSNKFMDRPFVHKYSIPRSSISPEVWGDDDLGRSNYVGEGQTPQLWSHIPLRRSHVIQSGKVQQMRNAMEGGKDTPNLVFAKKDMHHLGIQFKGTLVSHESLTDDDLENTKLMEKLSKYPRFKSK